MSAAAVLDFHMFSGQQADIASVYVAGRQVINDGQHAQQAEIDASYVSAMQRLAQKL
jgi:formimidoylglutamate deiminase